MPDRRGLFLGVVVATALLPGIAAAEAWPQLRELLFADRPIGDGSALLSLDAPARAHDAALVPIAVKARPNAAPEDAVRTVWLLVDENPAPMAGVFHVPPGQPPLALETRVRVNAYTPVHVVAELADGRLVAVERFVKAAGGCSAPSLKDPVEAAARVGRMKLRPIGEFRPGETNRAQVLISHPQYTGMQIDQVSRNWIPPDYIMKVSIRLDGRPVLDLDGDISLSEDPSITFAYHADGPGTLEVTAEDSQGRRFSQSFPVGPAS